MAEPSTRSSSRAHDPGRAFIAVYRYRENDFRPYIFRTNDYGSSWDLLTDGKNGIPATSFTRVVREDPDRKGLLYAGTEFGMYLSFDDGAHWQRFQLNLPVTPVTDLRLHRKDLVVSTQGRAFWVLDDVSPLHQMSDDVRKAAAHLFAPRTAYRGGIVEGASLSYYFAELPEKDVKLEVLDVAGNVVRVFKANREKRSRNVRPGGSGRAAGKIRSFRSRRGSTGSPGTCEKKGHEIPAGSRPLGWNARDEGGAGILPCASVVRRVESDRASRGRAHAEAIDDYRGAEGAVRLRQRGFRPRSHRSSKFSAAFAT